jgi:hypothetical protein
MQRVHPNLWLFRIKQQDRNCFIDESNVTHCLFQCGENKDGRERAMM